MGVHKQRTPNGALKRTIGCLLHIESQDALERGNLPDVLLTRQSMTPEAYFRLQEPGDSNGAIESHTTVSVQGMQKWRCSAVAHITLAHGSTIARERFRNMMRI